MGENVLMPPAPPTLSVCPSVRLAQLVTRQHGTAETIAGTYCAYEIMTTCPHPRQPQQSSPAPARSFLIMTSDVTSGRPDQWVGSCHRPVPAGRYSDRPRPDPTSAAGPSAIKRRQAKSNIQLQRQADNMNATVHEMPSATTTAARGR